MTFTTEHLVRFAHVDAAGIVFYPRYFELVNATVEDWFAESIGFGLKVLHLDRRLGIPTVKIETEFVSPSRLGDMLQFQLTMEKLGRSSVSLSIDVRCDDEVRFRVRSVLVCIDLDNGRSIPWPDDIRSGMIVEPA